MRSTEWQGGESGSKRDGRRMALALLVVGFSMVGGVRPASGQGLEEYDYENLGFRAIGIDLVYADPSQSEGTIGFGARADLGFLGPYIRVVPRFAFWKADVDDSQVARLERQIEQVSGLDSGSVNLGTIKRNYWVLGLDLQWTLSEPVVAPYLGLGLDVYILDDTGNAIRNTFLDDAVITAGVSGVAGLEFDVTRRIRLYGDVRGSLVTDASSLAFYAGVAYRF